VAARFWFAAIFVGVIGYAASFLLYNYAITRVRAAPASIIVNLIPVFGLASAVIWLGDSLTVARILGAILIGLSVTIFTATELADARNAAKASSLASLAVDAREARPGGRLVLVAGEAGVGKSILVEQRQRDIPDAHDRVIST
jgi:hypothetical protein